MCILSASAYDGCEIGAEMNAKKVPAGTIKSRLERDEEQIKATYVTEARKQYQGTELEIDKAPEVSLSQSGAWVAAWIWVDKATGQKHREPPRSKSVRN